MKQSRTQRVGFMKGILLYIRCCCTMPLYTASGARHRVSQQHQETVGMGQQQRIITA
uniref:Uncharacterized protein n=1 Tax=Arundo donax TaxID=35708 RepID=A0A0A9H3Z8_ARUDO